MPAGPDPCEIIPSSLQPLGMFTDSEMEKTSKTILIIDSDLQNQLSLKRLLSELFRGVTLITADNGSAGIQLVKDLLPDVIFLNIRIANPECEAICASLNEDESLCDTPVVILTGRDESKTDRIRAINTGADGMIACPAEEEELLLVVRTMLKLKESATAHKLDRQGLEKKVTDQTAALQEELRRSREISQLLTESENRFRALFEKAPLSYQSLDINGHFIEVNEAWLETLGYTREEVVGRWFGDFLAPEYVEAFRTRFPIFLAQGKIHSEFYMIHKDGSRRFIAFDGRIGLKQDGSFKQTHCICTDATKRRQDEDKLKESEERFRLLYESAGVGIGYYSLDGVVLSYNEYAAKNMGGKPEDFAGKSILDLFPEQDAQIYLDRIRQAGRSETPEIYEDRVELPGKTTWFLSTFTRILDSQGAVAGIQIISNDITGHKEAEELLNASQESLREAQSLGKIGNWSYDPETERFTFSDEMYVLFDRDPLQGPPDLSEALSYFYPDDREDVRSNFRNAMKSGMTWEHDVRMVMPCGRPRWHHGRGVPCVNQEGKVIGIKGVTQDITERKLIEDSLRQMAQVSAASTDFIVIIGADFRYRFANQVYLNVRRIQPEEIIGRHLMDVIGEKRFEELGRPRVESALRGETIISLESTDLGGTEIRHLHVQVAPFREADGTISGAVISGRDITEIKHAEMQLHKFLQAIEQSSASVVITNPDGYIEFVNPKFSEITGYTFSESIGKNPRILKSGKQPQSFYEELWKTLSSGTAWKGEFLNKKKNGELYWESALISPIKNEVGEIINYLAVKDDITERKRTEIARRIQLNIARFSHSAKVIEDLLRTIRQELNQLFDTTNFFVARYFPESGTMKQLLFNDEMDSFDVWDARKSYSGQVAITAKTIFLRGEEIEAFRSEHNLDFLGTSAACWLGVPIIMNNQTGGVMVIQHYTDTQAYNSSDVALFEMIAHETGIYLERKQLIEDLITAKEKSEESEERFKSLHNASFGGIAIHDHGLILECNLGLAEMTGYTVEELRGGMDGLLLISESTRDLVRKNIAAGYEKPYEAIGVKKNGEEYPLRLEARNVTYKGKPVRTVEFRDITDIKRAEGALKQLNAELEMRVQQRTAELEASNKELESFSYSVSHDLRAPIRAIQAFGAMLASEHSQQLDDEGKRLLGVIGDQTRRMGKLIDDLLSFSRLGRQQMEVMKVDLAEIARNVFHELTVSIPDRVIQFDCKPSIPAMGDHAMLHVAFTNLLANAIKFTLPRIPANIEVGVTDDEGEVVYYVKDNGVGFDMRYSDKLFGVFQRLHSMQDFEGTGIGLSMVQRIVQHHGGRIWASSKVNEGATFFFTLGPKF